MKFLYFLIIIIAFYSCNASKKVSGNYKFEIECLGVELDGSQTLKAWGNGRNRFDAVEQAKKNAVNAVIFKGVSYGKQDCNKRPLITDPMAREKHEDYFNTFFRDKGEYLSFVNCKDERFLSKILRSRKPARQSVTHGVVVRVLRGELKKKLQEDGIFKN